MVFDVWYKRPHISLWGVRGARGLEPKHAEVSLSCLRPWEWGEWREEAGRVKER
jgi:hypothetical protein